jgi:RimJ/RimL family protein N-acetyltransferase
MRDLSDRFRRKGEMKKEVHLKTKRLDLKTLRVRHISDQYVNGLNDGQVNKFLMAPRQRKQTRKTVRDYVEANLNSPSGLLFGLFHKTTGDLIGTLRVHDISYFHYSCCLGICLFDRSYWGKGYGQEALKETVHFAFKKLRMHYIEAGIYQGNRPSVQLFKKCGFRKVATHRDKYRYDASFRPVLIFGKTDPDFNVKLLK